MNATNYGHIGTQRLGDQLEVLEHHGEHIHIIPVILLANVDAVEEDLALLGIIQSA